MMAGSKDSDGLTVNQAKFVTGYIASGNATAAYRAAYPKCRSDESGHAAAAKLLRNATVAAVIERHRQAAAKTAGVTAEWVVERLKREALLDGDGASHSARITALKALADILGMMDGKADEGENRRPATVRVIHEHRAGPTAGGPPVLAADRQP